MYAQVFIEGSIAYIGETRTVGTQSNNPTQVKTFGLIYQKSKRADNGEWVNDGPGIFFNVNLWGNLATNFDNMNLAKGSSVVVIGDLSMKESYTKKDGTEMPESLSITAKHIGISSRDRSFRNPSVTQPVQSTAQPVNNSSPEPVSAPADFSNSSFDLPDFDDAPF